MTDLVPVITPAVVVERDERTVRLGDVGIARENLRFNEPPDDDIPTLAATLKAAGQLQRLTVRPGRGKKEEAWMALDGRRRRLALGLLLDAGDIDEDYPVTVCVETDPARQAAAVLLTNISVPVHVADIIAAIGRMLKSKLTVSSIARALGYPEIDIKRLAALAGLPPAALVALRAAGGMTLKQAKLLTRLPDKAEQAELAQAALDGHGFQDWRITERLDDSRVTTRDRRCALVDPATYGEAGGRTEVDLFGELAPVLLDPDILTAIWMKRARDIAAVFEAEGVAVHVTAGPEPELPEDLEALGYVYGGRLPSEEMARYRAQREVFNERTEAARQVLAEATDPEVVDAAIIAMIRARVTSDQTGCGGRVVTTMVMWPASGVGVDIRCYTPEEAQIEEDEPAQTDRAPRVAVSPAYVPPEVEAPEPDTEGVNHVLHAVRTDVATRGLIRALADDPGASLTALIARLFNVLVRRMHISRSDSALAILATGFNPTDSRVIEALDGEVRQRLDDRRAAWQASGATVIAWVHALPHGEKMGLLAELTAISLDVREERTSQIRRSARAEAAELAALCNADITLHWTPDAPFLQPHSKGLLMGMLEMMGSEDERARTLKKSELVGWVVEQAAARTWAPASLSWMTSPENDGDDAGDGGGGGDGVVDDEDPLVFDEADDDGTGAFAVTPAGEAALDPVAA